MRAAVDAHGPRAPLGMRQPIVYVSVRPMKMVITSEMRTAMTATTVVQRVVQEHPVPSRPGRGHPGLVPSLPVDVLGTSRTKSTAFGALNFAICSLTWATPGHH